MKSRADKNWELIQEILAADASGREPRPFNSRQTLFGIPSAFDLEMEKLQAEISAKYDRHPDNDSEETS